MSLNTNIGYKFNDYIDYLLFLMLLNESVNADNASVLINALLEKWARED